MVVEDMDHTTTDGPVAIRNPRGIYILYFFLFCFEFKPSEPFLVAFLVGTKGFANYQVYQEIFALYVYTQPLFIVLVGLLSEFPGCGARCMLLVGAVGGLTTVLLTLLGNALWAQQAAQFTVAAAMASRYAVPAVLLMLSTGTVQFQESVHMAKAILLFSNCCSALLGEVLRDVFGVRLYYLFCISAVSELLAVIFAVLVPGTLRQAVGTAGTEFAPRAEE